MRSRVQAVMRGLDPGIHVFHAGPHGMDGRDKPGHDERREAVRWADT
ncbi:hypothetical protein ABIG06_007105 [Bradyrhizobium sp. USDA 326]|nr:hypothetical protein [Bradyrhizobium sp. RP6]